MLESQFLTPSLRLGFIAVLQLVDWRPQDNRSHEQRIQPVSCHLGLSHQTAQLSFYTDGDEKVSFGNYDEEYAEDDDDEEEKVV